MEERYKDNETQFIQKFGFDKIMQLDKETGGIFSRKIRRPDGTEGMLMTIFADEYDRTKEAYKEKEKLLAKDYATFKQRIYEYLVELKNQGVFRNKAIVGDLEDYDFIQGEFRRRYQNIFIDEKISPELKRKYYKGQLTAEDIKRNKDLFEVLKTKRVDDIFKARIKKAFLLKELRKEDFLELCKEYGKYMDNEKVIEKLKNFKFKDLDLNVIIMKINQIIHDLIRDNEIEYDEALPTSFKEQHPHLFLPETTPLEVRKQFCQGELTFETIRKNPELAEELMDKDLDVGFRKIRDGRLPLEIFNQEKGKGRGNLEENWNGISKERMLKIAKEYGKYLEVIDCNIFEPSQNFMQKKNEIEKQIEQKILTKEMKYDDTVPEFFKEKHPDLILEAEAPDELKEYFYDGYKENKELNFNVMKENPEWKKYLVTRNLERAFPEKYVRFIQVFGNEDAIKLGTKKIAIVDDMIEAKEEETMKIWYRATGGRFVPQAKVMQNIPEDEIDDYLVNSRKWAQEIEKNKDKEINEIAEIIKDEVHNQEYSEEYEKECQEIINKVKEEEYASFPILHKPKDLWNEEKSKNETKEIEKDEILEDEIINEEKPSEPIEEQEELPEEQLENLSTEEMFEKLRQNQEQYENTTQKDNTVQDEDIDINKFEKEFKVEPEKIENDTIEEPDSEIKEDIKYQDFEEPKIKEPDSEIKEDIKYQDFEEPKIKEPDIKEQKTEEPKKEIDEEDIKEKIKRQLEKFEAKKKEELKKENEEMRNRAKETPIIKEDDEEETTISELIQRRESRPPEPIKRVGPQPVRIIPQKKKIQPEITIPQPMKIDKIEKREETEHTNQNAYRMFSQNQKNDTTQLMHNKKEMIPIYDSTNMREIVLRTMKRMERTSRQKRLINIALTGDNYTAEESKNMIKEIAREYGISPETTKIIANNNIAIIYNDEGTKVKISDLFTIPKMQELEWKLWADEKEEEEEEMVISQIGKALRQIGVTKNTQLDMSELEEPKKQKIQIAITT